MATKTTGVEFKRFYSDIKYWPEKGDTYHEDVAYKVNGQDLPDDQDPGNVADGDEVTIEGGIVMNSPLYKEGSEPSVEAYFKRWKKPLLAKQRKSPCLSREKSCMRLTMRYTKW